MKSTRTAAPGCETLLLPGIFPQDMLTKEASSMSNRKISKATRNYTSLPVLRDGPSLLNWLDGQKIGLFGRGAVRASHSASPANNSELPTQDISGQSSCALSPSAALQQLLESRLRANLDVNGSPEYELTWKHWDMESGPPICALRALARRTSDNGCSGPQAGWPTPRASDNNQGSQEQIIAAGSSWLGQNRGATVATMAQLAITPSGWATPAARDWKNGQASQETMDRNARPLNEQAVMLAGWATPRAADAEKNVRSPDGAAKEIARKGPQNDLGLVTGLVPSGSPASTAKRGGSRAALNPVFSLWLMFGDIVMVRKWIDCAPHPMRKNKPL